MWCFFSVMCVFSSLTNFIPVKSAPTSKYAEHEVFKLHGSNFTGFPNHINPAVLKSIEFDVVHFETEMLLESLKDCQLLEILNLTRVTYDKNFNRKIKLVNLNYFNLDLENMPSLRRAEDIIASIFFYNVSPIWEMDQTSMRNMQRIQISHQSSPTFTYDAIDKKLEANSMKTDILHFFKAFDITKFIISSSVLNLNFIPNATKELSLHVYSNDVQGSFSELLKRCVNLESLEARMYIDTVNISYSDLPSSLKTLLLRNFNLIPDGDLPIFPNLTSLTLEKVGFNGGNGADFFKKCHNVKELGLKGRMEIDLAVIKPLNQLQKLEIHSHLNLNQSTTLEFNRLESVYIQDPDIFLKEEFKLNFLNTISKVKKLVILGTVPIHLFKYLVFNTQIKELLAQLVLNPKEKNLEFVEVEAFLTKSGVADKRCYVYLRKNGDGEWSNAGIPDFHKIWTWIEVQRNKEIFTL